MTGSPALIFLAVVGASVLASFSDWLFMDALIHRYYLAEPQIWRSRGGAGRIVLSQAIGTLNSAAVIALCMLTQGEWLAAAAIAWVAGPLPVTLQNVQWMKLHPAIGASHAAAWLIRGAIAAAAAALLLRP